MSTSALEAPSVYGPAFDENREAMLVFEPLRDGIDDANAAAARLLGHDRAALRAMPVSALHPDQRPALVVFTQAVLAEGQWWTQGLTPRHGAGKALRLEYAGCVLSGEPTRLLVTLFDLDERERRRIDREADAHMRAGLPEWQRMERIFRDIERGNRLILRAAGEGIYGVNADGITTFVNPAAERMLGWASADLVGKDMHATVHHTHAGVRITRITTARSTRPSATGPCIRSMARCSGARTAPVSLSSTPRRRFARVGNCSAR